MLLFERDAYPVVWSGIYRAGPGVEIGVAPDYNQVVTHYEVGIGSRDEDHLHIFRAFSASTG